MSNYTPYREALPDPHITVVDPGSTDQAEVARLKGIVEVNDQRLADLWDEKQREIAALKEQLKQATEKAAMFGLAAEAWRYIAKQYQDARAQDLLKKET